MSRGLRYKFIHHEPDMPQYGGQWWLIIDGTTFSGEAFDETTAVMLMNKIADQFEVEQWKWLSKNG